MPVFPLSNKLVFPNVANAEPDGLLAYGGDLTTERLHLAYQSGIFPWYSKGEPILWWSPNPRFVLYPEKLKISKSMKSILNQKKFKITYNQCFDKVISLCQKTPRTGQLDTWITSEMEQAYIQLHKKGIAKSVEVWQNGELVGGLYGIDLGHVFCGESMFAKVSNASKVGFITMVQDFQKKGGKLIDCQVYTDHLASLGAEEIERIAFLKLLEK